MKIYLNGIATWEVPKYTYSDPHMGVRSISLTLEHPSNCLDESIDVPDFKDATVEYNGESFYISSAKPTGEKSTGSLNYKYTLVFKGAEDRLNSLIIRDLAEVSVNTFVSQGASFSISADLKVFSKLIENNLKYYIGDEWSVILNEDPLIESTESRIDVKSITAFELLQKAYELYNVRWKISGTTITIGYTPDSALHVFDYGKDGGLAKISRTVSDVGVYNRVIGSGGTRNIPMNYFTNRYSNFPADPNPVSDVANIKNLMPKAFRDSVIAKSLPYKDYAENAESIAEIGLREIAVEPNEKIYPSITGVTEEGIGRIDKIIAYEDIDEQTFNIWVKDIGFDLSHDDYTLTEEAKISFTSGNTTGYEYTILARDDKRVVVEDTSKSHDGVSSKYRITLIKSNEDEDIGRDFIPNEHLFPSPNDTFVIYNIALPHYYVLKAEERLQAWLEEQLYDLIVDKPSYLIEPYDGFFNLNPDALNKLESGNKVSVINDILAPTPIHLHISNITIKYGDSVVPKYSIVVSDKVEVNGSTVDRLSSRIDSVENRQYFSVDEIKDIISNLNIDRKYISKMHNDTARGHISFQQGITVNNGAEIKGLTKLDSAYFGKYTHKLEGGVIDSAGNAELESLVLRSFLEVPSIRYNELEYIGEEIIIGAGAVLKGVEHLGDDRYRLTLKLEDGQFNPFRPSDLLKGIYNMDEDGNFTDFGTTYVSVSSIEEHEMIVILADESDVVGNSNMPPRKFMHLARIGNFIDTDRQSYISLSAKDRAITQYGGVNAFAKKNKQGKNVRAGVVTTQWGRAEGLEFIENFENLPITKDSDVLYTDTLLYNKQIKVDYEGIVIKEYIDRGQWFEGMECQVTETTIDEAWYEAEKFRLIDRPIVDDAYTTTEKPTRESEDWMLILSFKEEIDGSRGSVTFFAKPAKYKKGDRWILTEDIQLLNNFYKKGQILEATYATNSDSDWRLMLIEGDEEETEGINLIRNYTFKEGAKHWGSIEGSIVGMDDEIPTDYYTPSINVLGDEYGYEYAITTENDELIIFDE